MDCAATPLYCQAGVDGLASVNAAIAALQDRIDFLEIVLVTVAALTFGLLVASLLRRVR